MDGLECSEILFSGINSPSFRLDAEFYSKQNLHLTEIIADLGGRSIRDAKGILDCSAFYPSITDYYNTSGVGIPFLRVNEISNGLVQITSSSVFLPEHILAENKNTIAIAYPGDILIAKGGNTLAKVGLVTGEYGKYAISRDVIVLHTDKLVAINKHYLWAFLHSSYGQGILWRSASQTGQPHLTLPAIYNMIIPVFSESLQHEIADMYKASVEAKRYAQQKYDAAVDLLLSIFPLADFVPSLVNSSIRLFSEAFRTTGRLDAEYFQPKYEDYKTLLNSADTVLSLCNLYDENYTPQEEQDYKYIELANVSTYGGISDVEVIHGTDLPSRARRKVRKGQVIVSSVEGSLQSCALITEEYDEALCSTGFYILDSDTINSETLLVLFKSDPIQALMKQRCSGTILAAITKDEFLRMPFPIVDDVIQKHIADFVRQSFEARYQSNKLLSDAKYVVELAIERDEEKAMNWIRFNLTGL